jgi:hypothetical protein
MAVEFFSYGYDTLPGEGLGELVWQEMFPQIGSATYAVRSPADWKVTAVSGADRTVSISAGRGFGLGVIDKTLANDTIQLAAVAGPAGTVRWDLITCRRDPTPSKGVSEFRAIVGGATPVIPGARLSGPGIHDQPLALVPVISGQTQPGNIIDLRTWVGDGGGLVANHDLVRSYLNKAGTRVVINGLDWLRQVGDNDTLEWKALNAVPHTEFTTAQNTAATNTVWGMGAFSRDTSRSTDSLFVTVEGLDALRVRDAGLYSVTVLVSFTEPIGGVSWLSVDGNYTVTMGSGLQNFSASMPNVMLDAGQILNPVLAHGSSGGTAGNGTRKFTSRVRISRLA